MSSARSLHRRLALVIFLLLAVSAATGLAYRVGKKWFGVDGETGKWIMGIHSGAWMGDFLSPVYVFTVGAGLLYLIVTGCFLLRSRGRRPTRMAHRILGAVLLLSLTATALTGILYQAGESFFGFSEDTGDLLMKIHEGGWLGREGKVFYVLFLGLGLFVLGGLGVRLLMRRKEQ